MKNAGYTLVEALIVVVIIAVALTLGVMSINTIFALDVRQTSKELAGELNKEKVACMTRQGDVYLHLYKTDSGVWIEKYENDILVGEAEKIGKASTAVTYSVDGGPVGYDLGETGIYMSFNRSDGSFTTIEKAWELFDPAVSPPVSGDYYTGIVISSRRNERTVTLCPQTGKVAVTV